MSDTTTCQGIDPNSDISGIGVRISFYLQSVLLALLSVHTKDKADISDALNTLVITNLAYCVTTLCLGFKAHPELNLYDGLMVSYLLLLSWSAIVFCLARLNRFRTSPAWLKYLSILQFYMVFAVILLIYVTSTTFGSNNECNGSVKMVIFASLPATHSGRVLGIVGTCFLLLTYTVMTICDYCKPRKRTGDPESRSPSENNGIGSRDRNRGRVQGITLTPVAAAQGSNPQPQFSFNLNGVACISTFLIFLVFALAVTNTELLRLHNRPLFAPGAEESSWGFGQILPMFLIVIPLMRVVVILRDSGLGLRNSSPTQKSIRVKTRAGASEERTP